MAYRIQGRGGYPPVALQVPRIRGTGRGDVRNIWNVSVREDCASATEHTVQSLPVPVGSLARVDVVAATDETNAATSVAVGLMSGARKIPLVTEGITVARCTVGWQSPLYVPAGWRLYASFRGATSGDDLLLTAWGELLALEA